MWLRHYSPPPPPFPHHHSSPSVFTHHTPLEFAILMQESTITSKEMEFVSCAETISDKVCFDCKTSKTPLWRSGPAGPKSLCNACGIRYRKKRSVVGSDKKREKQPPAPPQRPSQPPTTPTSSSSSSTTCNTISSRNREMGKYGCDFEKKSELGKRWKINVVPVGKEVVLLRRPRSPMKKVKREKLENEYKKFGEVERAAFLLMSLSCGSVFA